MDGTAGESLTRRLAVYWLPVVAWAAFIFYLSSQSEPPRPPGVTLLPDWTLFAHFGLYFLLGALLYRGFRGRGLGLLDARRAPGDAGTAHPAGFLPAWALLLSLIAGALYGASDEIHQYFVPLRQMDIVDWLVDVAGIAAGALVILAWHHWRSKP